jgi:hypothetical protein
MNPLKSLPAALSLLVVVGALTSIWLLTNDGAPGTSTVKGIVEKQMAARFPGCAIKSISIVRGGKYLNQGHAGRVPYGTPIYPTFVKVSFVAPLPNGSQEFSRTWYFYKNSQHQWARDTEVN